MYWYRTTYKIDNITEHRSCICCTGFTMLTFFYKQCHVVSDPIKHQLSNSIQFLNICSLIIKGDDVPVFVDAQHRSICAVPNRLISGFWCVGYTRCTGIVQNGGTLHKSKGVSYLSTEHKHINNLCKNVYKQVKPY